MTPKISFIAIPVIAVLALVPAAWGNHQYGDAFDRATQSQIGLYPDAIDRAVNAKLAAQPNVSRYPDAVDRAVANRVQSGGLLGHADRYELDLPNGPVTAPTTGSGREIEWPQVGIGFGIGMVVLLGLLLAIRFTRSRPFAHG